ncbi:MAG: AMIN domain-containing protein [Desulfovibrio sp.]|jgi:hypothetical protein|nr:AMIN domain-containing protein [Desulfovibrio sp.]
MNKSLLALLLGVCFVGMCLLMYQETQEGSQPAKPAQTGAAADRGAGPLLPVPQELSAVPVPPQAGQPAKPAQTGAAADRVAGPPARPAQAGRFAGTSPRADASPADKSPIVPRPEKESNGVKARETQPDEEKNAGGEKAPPAEKIPVAEKAPALSAGERPAPAAASSAEQAAHVPAVPALPAASVTSPGQSVRAAETPPRHDAGNSAKLVVFARDKGATVRLTNGRPVRYQTMTLTGPDRVVVDVEGLTGLKAPGVPKNPMVANVRLGTIEGKTRIVIDLTAKPGHTRFILSGEKDTLDIRIDQ